MRRRKKHTEQKSGADMIEVEYDEGHENVYVRKDNIGLGI